MSAPPFLPLASGRGPRLTAWAAATAAGVAGLTWRLAGGLDLTGLEMGLVAAREVTRIGVVAVVGFLVALALLRDDEHGGVVPARSTTRLATGLRIGVWAWLAGTVLELALRYLSTTGTAISAANDAARIGSYALGDRHGALYSAQLILVLLLLALVARKPIVTRLAVVRALLVAGLAAATLPLTGHAALLPPGPRLAVVLHVLSGTLWVGGLGALLVAVWVIGWVGHGEVASRRVLVAAVPGSTADPLPGVELTAAGRALAGAVQAYSSIALGASLTAAVTGLLMALGEAGVWLPAWNAWTAIVLGKLALTGAALAAGLLHRLWTLRELEAGRPLPFVRLAAVELSVLAAVLALAVLLPHSE